MAKKDYRVYIYVILDTIKDIDDFVNDMTYNNFVSDEKTLLAVERGIEIIAEAMKKIPDSIKNKYPDISWNDMIDIGDKLSLVYYDVDLEQLWKVIKQEILSLKAMLSDMIAELKDKE